MFFKVFGKKFNFFQKTLAFYFGVWYNISCFMNYLRKSHMPIGVFEGGVNMAKCSICGKGVVFGQTVSHSHRKTNRTWKPNIRKVKAIVDGTPKTVAVCSRCLRSGKVNRA